MTNKETPATVLEFWFDETVKPLWYNSTPEFDQQLYNRFISIYKNAKEGHLIDWESTADGALALVIILDQFPLNMFRGEKASFATEAMSREVAQRAIDRKLDVQLNNEQKMFIYLPYMHSESLKDQDQSIILFKNAALDDKLQFAEHHRNIVKRFGRFPHRNEILGRASTTEEINWLASDEGFKG